MHHKVKVQVQVKVKVKVTILFSLPKKLLGDSQVQ